MSGAKFKIGDYLKIVGTVEAVASEKRAWGVSLEPGREERYLVVTILADECPGGTQYHYNCRVISTSGISNDLVRLNECEVRISHPFSDDKHPRRTLSDALGEARNLAMISQQYDLAAMLRQAEQDVEYGITFGSAKIAPPKPE